MIRFMFKKAIFCLGILSWYGTTISAQDTTLVTQLSRSIQGSIDDVEELNDGEVYINSTDLELANDPAYGGAQTIGLHFRNINIPPGATITSAYLQFGTDEISIGACNLNIYGEASGDPESFNTIPFNVSDRTLSSVSVNWSPANWWEADESSIDQRSPDLSNIVQSIIGLAEWQSGNALNFIIEGNGQRTAHSYDGDIELAPSLMIEFSETVQQGPLEQIYLNELMAANTVVADEYNEFDDWVELYNNNANAVLIDGLYLSDDPDNPTKWQIGGPATIPAYGFQVIWLDDDPEQGMLHAPFKISSSGESLLLSQEQNGELVLLDAIDFPQVPENISYGRQLDGTDNWVFFGEYSPLASNNGNGLYLDATVNFSVADGYYDSSFPVTISCSDPLADIRYTLDGSPPALNSALYTAPLTVNQTRLIRAAAFRPGFAAGPKAEAFYLLNANHDLPVVQVTIDPKYLWDEETGMYISGVNGIPGYCSADPRNWNQDWERPIGLRYFEADGDKAFQLNAGMKIGGGCSRGFSMKGFNFFLRGNEYGDSQINYPLFQDLGIGSFKRFKLRASGNDVGVTMIRDAVIQSLLYNTVDIDLMAYAPVAFYLNGDYFGYYGMREFFSKHYLESHHGVDQDSIDLFKNPYGFPDIKEGDPEAWFELTDFISDNSLANAANMDYVNDKIDVNEFMNYHIAQIYIANFDWPANNVAVWRHQNNGRWRWMLFDTDLSSGYAQWTPSTIYFNAIEHATATDGPGWPNGPESTLFLRKLLDNTDFAHEFVQRSCTFGQVLFAPERATFFVDSLANRIAGEMPATIANFEDAPEDWYLWDETPVSGSIPAWQSHLADFKFFFNQRLVHFLDHYQNHFGYSGRFNLQINYDASTPGKVVLHDNDMSIPFQYSGEYFRNIPIQIKAIPDPGYTFVRWEETGDTNATINFQSNSNQILTPIFVEEGTTSVLPIDSSTFFELYPIPTSETLFLKTKSLNPQSLDIYIFNALGQIAQVETVQIGYGLQEHAIDVRSLASGVYVVNINWEGEDISRRIVIK